MLRSFVLTFLLGALALGVLHASRTSGISGNAEIPTITAKPLAEARIVINKAQRKLQLYDGSELVESFRIALGNKAVGQKLREGDGRTPEGRYYICAKNPQSKYRLSLGLSYPNVVDARRGLDKGLIKRREHDAIVAAIGGWQKPSWDTAIGGEIFIHGNGSASDWTTGCISLDDGDISKLYGSVRVGTPVEILPGNNEVEAEAFAGAVRDKKAMLGIESSVDGGAWTRKGAIYPLKGEKVLLRINEVAGGHVRWYRISPDISKIYNNANLPWEKDAYKWKGFDKIEYLKEELTQFRGHWLIGPFEGVESSEDFRVGRGGREDVGSFWFQVEVAKDGKIQRSAGIAESDHRGLSVKVLRVSIREGEGYLGYLTSFFNVPGVFGSVTYQSENYIGVDCADVLVAAYGKWKNRPTGKDYNVAMLVSQWNTVKRFGFSGGKADKDIQWGRDVRPGDFIAVRYGGSRQYQHVGALYRDGNSNGVFDGGDVVLHAGPEPLRYGYLRDGNFDGQVAIIRP